MFPTIRKYFLAGNQIYDLYLGESGDSETVRRRYSETFGHWDSFRLPEFLTYFWALRITVLETSCLGCTQCFTGANGNVQSYGFGTAQFLYSQQYSACFRQELGKLCLNNDILVYFHVNFAGYCSIQFRESSITSPDPFGAYILSIVNWYYNNRLDNRSCYRTPIIT